MTATYLLDDRVHADLDPDTLWRLFQQVQQYLVGPAPEFGSPRWIQLPEDDPCKIAAVYRGAMGWWNCRAIGVPADVLDHEVARRLNDASKAVQAADPAVWRRVASDRAAGRPQGRARSMYGPAKPLPRVVVPAGSAWGVARV